MLMSLRTLSGLSLRDLEYATTIANEQSFGRAAEICGVSQPAISQQIKKLETLLDLKIFERRGRAVILTESGRQVLFKAEAILADARGLFEIASDFTDPLKGDIRLGVIPTLGPYFMPHILQPLRGKFPDLRLRPYEDTTDNLISLLKQRKIDIALMADPVPGTAMNSTNVFFEPFVLACPVDHLLAGVDPLSQSDIATLELLMLSREHCLRDQSLALCQRQPSDTTRVASSIEMLRQMIAVGEGCALLPALAASNLRDMRRLIQTRPVSSDKFGRQIIMVWRKSDTREADFNLLSNFLTWQMNRPAMRGVLGL
jgi:LysR family hydrogen peroxide-inducible transcriptional activator